MQRIKATPGKWSGIYKERLFNMKIFDLPCFDGRKSFYGKAKVVEEAPKKPGPDMTLKESYRAMMSRRIGRTV